MYACYELKPLKDNDGKINDSLNDLRAIDTA